MADYVIAIDQGTTSSRAIIFDKKGTIVETGQKEHEQILPKAGWVEHDATEIWHNVQEVIGIALSRADLTRHDIAAVGITNQRETAVVWDKTTRQAGVQRAHRLAGHPSRRRSSIASHRTAASIGSSRSSVCRWPRTSPARRSPGSSRTSTVHARRRKLGTSSSAPPILGCCGTSPVAQTAACTPRMSPTHPARCSWTSRRSSGARTSSKPSACPCSMLPEIRSSSEVYGTAKSSSLLRETPIAGILGDQQAATFGQAAFQKGESKNTYGTGCFLIFNTGEDIVHSKNGLLTTVGYKLGDEPTHYAGGVHRRHRIAHPVAARSAGHHLLGARSRTARRAGRGQRRGLHRAGVLRPLRTVLCALMRVGRSSA